MHKNLFFGLAYLHAILQGRKKYGRLGWNLPYKFDDGDFEVSQRQLSQIMENGSVDYAATLEMLKYFFAHINYAGKIQRVEDQVTLNAIVEDLFNDTATLATDLPADLTQSHYGFPTELADFYQFCDRNIPDTDPYDIFGFHWNIESHLRRQEISGILVDLHELTKSRPGHTGPGDDSPKRSIAMTSLKTSLRSSSSEPGGNIERMLKNDQSLLNLFIALQQLLGSSTLDSGVAAPALRYDHNIDQEVLPKRDLHDQQVSEVAGKLLEQLDSQFDRDTIQRKFPIRWKAPLNNAINRELTAYGRLLQAIRETVSALQRTVDGAHPRPEVDEALWTRIQENRVPDSWRKWSFQTAHESLADYLVELGLKLEFWKSVVASEAKHVASFWLPAFFDPKSFLTCLIQAKSRVDGVPMTEVRNEYEVLGVYQVETAPTEKHVRYIHGLYLEGAEWDLGRRQLVEMTTTQRFTQFPAIRVRTVERDDQTVLETPEEAHANFSLNRAKPRKKKKPAAEGEEAAVGQATGAEVVNPVHQYRCPLFKTTLRLSPGITAQNSGPVECFRLDTEEAPAKWTKRAVALLLEPGRGDAA